MKVCLTSVFLVLFLNASAQSYFGVVAGVGSGYRFLKSPYVALNFDYNNSETPSFAQLIGFSYNYRFVKPWAIQTGIQMQNSGFGADYDPDFEGEIINDSIFNRNLEVTGMKKMYTRLHVPVVWQYRGKAAQNWKMVLGLGVSANFIMQEKTVLFKNSETITSKENEFGVAPNKFIAGTVLQIGWINQLKSGNELSFVVGYNQDLKPIKNMLILRKLLLLHFTLGYSFRA